ncbi:MAG: DUF3047 domain-containing protein [Gemmatimonadota bacterium]
MPVLLVGLVGAAGLVTVLLAPVRVRASTDPASSRRLVVAVDGLGWEVFDLARGRGLFRRFQFAGRHVVPYPSMSHPSWNEVIGTRRLFGARGNIRTLEARWFDLDAMRVMDDPRQVIARQTAPYAYHRAWDYTLDPVVEPLQYLPGRTLFDRELREAERAILEDFKDDLYTVFIGGLDAIAHTHRDELWPYLRRLDAMIDRVADSLGTRGPAVELWLVSDHGNAGGFAEGGRENHLVPVSMDAAIKRAGLVKRDTGRIERKDEVSVVTFALASMINVYFADLGRRRTFATAATAVRGVDFVTWLEVNDDDRYVVILGAAGESRLRWRGMSFAFERVSGNPLRLADSLLSSPGAPRWMPDSVMRAATMAGPYPDAAFRLMQSAEKQVENAPDVIVNLRDGYVYAGDLGSFVKMVRTHGSLGAGAAFGVLATSERPVPANVRSAEILDVMGLTPERLLRRSAVLRPRASLALADSVARAGRALPTGRDDDSQEMNFLRRVRPLVLSMDYFPLPALRNLYGPTLGAGRDPRVDQTRAVMRHVDAIAGIRRNVDTLLAMADSMATGTSKARLRVAEDRIRGIKELSRLPDLRAIWSGGKGAPGSGAVVRRGFMTAWTVPYFLDAALVAPEYDSIPDPRDLSFAQRWHGWARRAVRVAPERLLDDTSLATRVFSAVFAERKVAHAVEPALVPLLYDPDVAGTTVVFVPGRYDELFDHEMFTRGMRAVRERLGVRMLTVPMDGRCGAPVNAARIAAHLRLDIRRRLERGYSAPRYLIIGYSKGGVDATEALALAPGLTRAHVAAFVTIGTPHRGTVVAERSEVPTSFVNWTVPAPMPAGCDSTSASESLWPATRSAFWAAQDNGRAISALTRFFSVSLAIDAEHSHPWMKITKQIGQFQEPNDGVVSVSASRFPKPVRAVDLGVVEADHILGRLASSFPQDAFLEALIVTIAELGALEPGSGESWREMLASREGGGLWRAMFASRADADREAQRVPPFAASLRAESSLPGGATGWTPQALYRAAGIDRFADLPVSLMDPRRQTDGVRLRCDQRNMMAFRREYEFFYDAANTGAEDDAASGWSLTAARGSSTGRACRIATTVSLARMTTAAFRFRPVDYPRLRLKVRVDRNVSGVDVTKAANGINDAALRVWLVLRDTRPSADRRMIMFGYVWAGADASGQVPPAGAVSESRTSRRNVIVTTLPEAWVVAVGGPAAEGRWETIERDLDRDLARAFPGIPVEALQVIAITLSADSDDTHGGTEAYLESLEFQSGTVRPSGRVSALKR